MKHALEGRILATVRKSDAVAYETMKMLADAVKPMTSVIRSVTPPLVYDFTGQLVDSQRKFAEDVLHLTARPTSAPAKQATEASTSSVADSVLEGSPRYAHPSQ